MRYKKGDLVIVHKNNFGFWTVHMDQYDCRRGYVEDVSPCCYKIQGMEEWNFDETCLSLVKEFKVGDRVLIHRPYTDRGRSMFPGWIQAMDKLHLKIGDVYEIDGNDIRVREDTAGPGGWYYYNANWLSHLEEKPVLMARDVISNSQCVVCGLPAFTLFNTIECSNGSCVNHRR